MGGRSGFRERIQLFDRFYLKGSQIPRILKQHLENLIIHDKFDPAIKSDIVQKLAFYEYQNIYYDYF